MLYERIEKLLKANNYTRYKVYKLCGVADHTLDRIKATNNISKPVYLKLKELFQVSDIELLGESEDTFNFLPIGHATLGSVRKTLDAQRKTKNPFKPNTLKDDNKTIDFPIPTAHPPMPERRPDETFEEYYWRLISGI